MTLKTIDAKEFMDDVAINKADLDSAFINQASLYAHYGRIYSEMMMQEQKAKLNVEVVYATLDKDFRDDAAISKTKVTESQIESYIKSSPAYIAAVKNHIEAKGLERIAYANLGAFAQRRDMLIQMGSSQRQEMKGELTMKASHDTSNATKNLKWSEDF